MMLSVGMTLPAPAAAQAIERDANRTAVRPVPVAPLEQWLAMEEVLVGDEPIVVHLRIGYERPIVFPEPVSVQSRAPLPFTDVTLDAELVVFAPGGQLRGERLVFIGRNSAHRYELDVSASRYGSRVPIRLVRP